MLKNIKFLLLLLISCATYSWANVPPPPVNQNIGIPDSIFNNLEKLNCAYCHKSDTLTQAERNEIGWTFVAPTVKDGILADRHHAKVDTIMKEGTQAPFGTAGEPYKCLSCHKLQWNEASSTNELSDNFKDCLNCHRQVEGKASVHHLTQQARKLNCKYCHGDRIDNPNDGHYIPTRPVSPFTPRTSRGKGPNGEGACTYCHNQGVDAITGVMVQVNSKNHHAIGIGQWGVSALQCVVCHAPHGLGDQAIRTCENCHGVNSIHSIQADSDGDGIIIIGQEKPFYGHIGGKNSADCKGCHVGSMQNSLEIPGKGYIVPQLANLSKFKIPAGSTTTITVSGQALINKIVTQEGIKTYKSIVTLTNNNDNTVRELIPSFISVSSLKVTIPSDLDAGNYYLRAKKGEKESNPMSLVITPNIFINSVDINNNIFTIKGNGFSKYIDAIDSGTKITLSEAICEIQSWTDKKIVTTCDKKCGLLKINGIFGSTSKDIACNGDSDYDKGFARGKSDACSWKNWAIPSAYIDNDTYIKAYDVGWESCDRSNPPTNNSDYDLGFTKGKADACDWKTWAIEDYYQGNTTYIKGYDEGWESCDRSNPPVNDNYNLGYTQGKEDSCNWKTWAIPDNYLDDNSYIKGYDEGWESCR